eukprot:TRINITY_DN36902_c0_g1_i1.p1 TRINITY_DN36902_c0_g1~~TRINITY_DN36902_c0_g1_i1.p1  ORF type:complete len:676 (+),score=109.44 TRINITY_DN36902_c0_g1_i1:38-2065(+)
MVDLNEPGPVPDFLQRHRSDNDHVVVPPSHTFHPAHPFYMPYNPHVPGPVSAVYRLVKGRAEEPLGWATSDKLDIVNVDELGNAYRCGLREGMRVLSVDGKLVNNVGDLKELMGRGKTVFEVEVQLPAQPLPRRGQSVVIHGISGPPQLTRLNGQHGQVVEFKGTAAIVDVYGQGQYPIQVANLHYDQNQWDINGSGPVTHNRKQFDVFPPGIQELAITKKEGEGLGLQLEGMILTGVRTGSPADVCGSEPFLGWKLTHVNGSPVNRVDDVTMHARDQENVFVRFEVDEARVRKRPNEPLGCELLHMIVQGVTPGSPAERYNIQKYIGYRLTHINGQMVTSIKQVSPKTAGCDSLSLRFEPEEIVIPKRPDEPLGINLENMIVQHTVNESPAKSHGVGKFLGRKLTHVNGHRVEQLIDVDSAMKRPIEEGKVVLRFEREIPMETNVSYDNLPVGVGSAQLSAPPVTVMDSIDKETAPLPVRTHAIPASVVPLPQQYTIPSPVDANVFVRNTVPLSSLIQTPTPPNIVMKPYDMTKIDRLLQDVDNQKRRRDADEQRMRISALESKLSTIESRSRPAIPWERNIVLGHAGLSSPVRSPQRLNRRCCTCGGLPEVECRDCALFYCRSCCTAAHKGHFKSTHTNMVVRSSPATSAPLEEVFENPLHSKLDGYNHLRRI